MYNNVSLPGPMAARRMLLPEGRLDQLVGRPPEGDMKMQNVCLCARKGDFKKNTSKPVVKIRKTGKSRPQSCQ